MKILVLRFSSIGDIVLTSSVLRCVKEQIDGVEIHFLTKKKFFGLLEHNPRISKIFTFENELGPTLTQLQSENYDLILDLHHNLRSLWVKMVLGKPSVGFDKLNIRKWLYVNIKLRKMPDVHITERYLQTLKILGVEDDGLGLEFYPCDCDAVNPNDLPLAFQKTEFAILSIGGTHFTKKMPVDKWIDLINRIPIPAIIIGGREDFETGNEIEKQFLKSGKPVWNGCGKFTIGGSAHLIRQSVLVLTHDTGMMHIAAAFKKPTVAIWGNTTPELGMYPFRTPHFNLEVRDLECRPCSKIGYAACPKGHFKCMKDQNFAQPELLKFIQIHSKASVNE